MRIFLLTLTFAGIVSAGGGHRGSTTNCPPKNFTALPDFDFDAFSGRWFVQRQQEAIYTPEHNNFCATQFWSRNGTRFSVDTYANERSVNGKPVYPSSAYKVVNKPDSKRHIDPSKMIIAVSPESDPLVQPGLPFWIVAIGKSKEHRKYEWVLATSGLPQIDSNGKCICAGGGYDEEFLDQTGRGTWILTRKSTPSSEVLNLIEKTGFEMGLDMKVLKNVTHQGCKYEGGRAKTESNANSKDELLPEFIDLYNENIKAGLSQEQAMSHAAAYLKRHPRLERRHEEDYNYAYEQPPIRRQSPPPSARDTRNYGNNYNEAYGYHEPPVGSRSPPPASYDYDHPQTDYYPGDVHANPQSGSYDPRANYDPRTEQPQSSGYDPRMEQPQPGGYDPHMEQPQPGHYDPRMNYDPHMEQPQSRDYDPRMERPQSGGYYTPNQPIPNDDIYNSYPPNPVAYPEDYRRSSENQEYERSQYDASYYPENGQPYPHTDNGDSYHPEIDPNWENYYADNPQSSRRPPPPPEPRQPRAPSRAPPSPPPPRYNEAYYGSEYTGYENDHAYSNERLRKRNIEGPLTGITVLSNHTPKMIGNIEDDPRYVKTDMGRISLLEKRAVAPSMLEGIMVLPDHVPKLINSPYDARYSQSELETHHLMKRSVPILPEDIVVLPDHRPRLLMTQN